MMAISKMVDDAKPLCGGSRLSCGSYHDCEPDLYGSRCRFGRPQNTEALEESIEKLKKLAVEPVHGKRQWLIEHAWSILVTLLGAKMTVKEDEGTLEYILATGSFILVLDRFEADFSDNQRFAEQCGSLFEQ